MRRWLSVLAMLLLALGAASPALADKRVALIIGNSDYKGAPLDNPTKDADIVAASLGAIGFSAKVLKNADLDAFDAAVNAFADTAKGADIALFYFAGHGFTVNDGIRPVSMLLSTSANVTASSERVLRAGGLALDDISGSLAGRAKVTLIFVDACRNDPRVARAIGGQGRGFAALDTAPGGSVFIGLSTRLGSTARDGDAGKGSPFARAFAAHVVTKGMRIDDMFRQVRDAVRMETAGAQLPEAVRDDLPDGAVTLVEAPAASATPVPNLDTVRVARGPVKAPLTDCDRLASAPFDYSRPGGVDGVELESIDAARAVPACRAAVAANPNDPRLAMQLGRALEKAGGADAEALALYQKAVDAGYVHAMINVGIVYAKGLGVPKDPVQAANWYRKSADAGDLTGMISLGVAYVSGAGVTKNPAEAVRLFRVVADAGDARGMRELGWAYNSGVGVPKDIDEAVRWYRKAADAGNAPAMVNLGGLYQYGAGVPKDLAAAADWYRKAADAGNRRGMTSLGLMYENGAGAPKDPAQALSWYRKAADLGDFPGMNLLGGLYLRGVGAPKDPAEAMNWRRKAADAGFGPAMTTIGEMYLRGDGVTKDTTEGLNWFRKAADAGYLPALDRLGYMYSKGLWIPKDEAQALVWYRKGADAGYPNAMRGLGQIYETGAGVPKDPTEAARWYRIAADAGDIACMVDLGRLYKAGEGVPKDAAEAARWYQKAADAGFKSARKN
jgi:TPR repeat protein